MCLQMPGALADDEEAKEREKEDRTTALELRLKGVEVRLRRAALRRDEAAAKLHELQDQDTSEEGAGTRDDLMSSEKEAIKAHGQLKAAQDVVAGLQQERLVTEKELEALEAAEMAWLVRSKRPLSMPNSPSKERLSGIGGEREHAQAVGREQEERERRSGEALHQAKCLWVGRAVDDKERLRRERAKEIAKRAERRRLREEAERERIGC